MTPMAVIGCIVLAGFGPAAGGDTLPVRVTVRHADAPDRPSVFDVGDTIGVTVTLPGTAAGTAVTVRWLDSYERLVAEARAPVGEDRRAKVRVLRGGSWRNAAGKCRSANRDFLQPSGSDLNVGFRCVRTVATP